MEAQNTLGLRQTYAYNVNSQLTSITDPAGRTLTFAYDANGRIQTMTDPASRVYTYSYDAYGNLTGVNYPDSTNPNGVNVAYLYENSNFPTALTGVIDENGSRYLTWNYDNAARAYATYFGPSTLNALSYSITYSTDAGGKVTSAVVTEPTGLQRTVNFTTQNAVDQITGASSPCSLCGDRSMAVTYDANGFESGTTDFNGNITNYTHDATGLELSRTEAYGTQDARTITTQWNSNLRRPTLITEPGRTTGYTYDGVGHVLTKTVTDTATNAARTTTYTYYSTGAAAGLLETVTDPLNHVTSYSYDSQGDLSTVTNAANQVTQITQYDANGMPLTIVDPNGVTTTLTYDARQRLKTRTVAGAQTQFNYDLVGNLTQVTLPTGSYLKYTYDAAHRLMGITDSVGDSIAYTLDNVGNRTAEKTYDPSNTLKKTLQRTYNNLNQLVTTMGGAGQTTQYTNDTLGNTTSIKDPLTNVTGQTFDALNRLATVVDPENGNTTYNYDPLDRVQDVTDPKGLNTVYIYDAFGDVTQQQSPDTGTTGYTYDLDGNRLTKTDAQSITTTYSYDALNRLTSISYPDPSRNVTYTYDQGTDGIGHLTGIQDPTGTTSYQYDAHGNTTQKTVSLDSHTLTVGYQYDTADNLTGTTYPSGMQVSYVRDAAERVTAVTENSNPIVSGITYEPFGPLNGFTYGNGLTERRSYDQDYRLTGITVPGVLAWTFQDNADDDITAITDGINTANSQTLGYDTLNRLTAASGAYGSQSYVYDLDGNRSQETLGGNTTTLGYDTASNKLLTVGSRSETYDAVGNLLSDGAHSYSYDAANRLTGYDSVSTAYLYNGLGQRAVKFPRIISYTDISDLPVSTNSWSVATADLMGNGHQDILSADGTLFMGDGTGHFTAGPSQTPATGVVFADINGDGKPDLIEVSLTTQVAVFLNTTQPGDTVPSFAAPVYFNASTGGISMVVAADVNGDGIPDLVVIDSGYNMVDVLINTTVQGGNTVTFSNPQALQAGTQVNWIAVGDLNGDGLADIMATNNMDNTISVFMNGTTLHGTTPNFAAQQVVSVGSFPNGVAIADLNGDGKQDIIVSSVGINPSGLNYFSVLLNTTSNGSMTASFAAEQRFITGSNPDVVVAVDVDGDGIPDVVTGNTNGTVSVLQNMTATNSSTISFAPQLVFSAGSDPEDLSVADLNGDGKPDLVVMDAAGSNGSPTVSILINGTHSQTTPSAAYFYDESGHVIGEYDANGNAIQEHIYLGDRPVAVVQGQGGSVGYVTTDQLNTPRAVTNASQTVEWSWTSDPFGNGQPTGSLTYNLRFPGQYYDAETGHNYNLFRDYDSTTGRYIESDPIGLVGGINTYSYGLSNPTINSDRSGLCVEDACVGEGALLSGLVRAAGFVASAITTAYELHKQQECRCNALNQEISAKVEELKLRYIEAIIDKHDLYNTRRSGPFSWEGHKFKYEQVQEELSILIGEAKALGCPYDPEADEWVARPFPDSPARTWTR